ncbi:MAG: hypothetical protein U9R79_19600 [Armatimonadota bacterium]|nr:hypothetical protein [Armatimonadota bacterium]
MRTNVILAAALIVALFLVAPVSAQVEDHYWELGVGCYWGGMGGLTELDVARYDWLYLCFGNVSASDETVAQVNRFLEINPDLKVVIRLWPIMSLGDCAENRYQATFLHYLYEPGVREGVVERINQQVSVVLENISRPENVVGLTFLEELPGHFSGDPFRQNEDGQEPTWAMERFREEIEAEVGRPLTWDDEMRRWWGEKWVQVINDIHAAMKEASRGRLIWYYQQTNHTSLDMVPEGTPLDTRMLMPIHWGDIIKPGLCDGFFAYPNNRQIWDRYTRLAREHDWLMFSQVSHPGRMRLCPWDECLAMATERLPQNMGYFFYCPGDCAANDAWNDDPGIPDDPEWNIRGVSQPLHHRRFLARQDVGMDIVRSQPPLRVLLDLPLDAAEPGGVMHVSAVVENAREPSFFLDPEGARAEGVTVTLTPPGDFTVDPAASPPATLELGEMAPGQRRLADWWVSVPDGFTGTESGPFTVRAEAEGATPTVVTATGDTAMPLAEPHEVGISGTRWLEPGFRLAGDVQPTIIIECISGTVRNPAISDGRARVQYLGTLERGHRLVIDPREGSRLITLPLLDDDGSSRADTGDPTGFRSFDEGYLVIRLRVGRKVEPGSTLSVKISGKAQAGAQSHVVLRFGTEDGETVDVGGLTNRFGEQWREAEAEFTVPESATELQWVYLYRFGREGRVWYGPVSVRAAGEDDTGADVSEQVRGRFPTLRRGTFTVIGYEDESQPTTRPRARVQLALPE